jgi:transcriptional regulator GlxA family with amidase domain
MIERLAARVAAAPSRIRGVDDLVRLSGLGRATLARLLKTREGLTPSAFLLRIRLELARAALADTDQGVLDVAAAAGFGSPASFHRRFAQAFGAPPSAWRRTVRARVHG